MRLLNLVLLLLILIVLITYGHGWKIDLNLTPEPTGTTLTSVCSSPATTPEAAPDATSGDSSLASSSSLVPPSAGTRTSSFAEPLVHRVASTVAVAQARGARQRASPAPGAARRSPLPGWIRERAGQALAQAQSGDCTGAEMTINQMLQVAPREPYMWLGVAEVRKTERRWAQAKSTAMKALSFAPDERLTTQLQDLLKEIRQARADSASATCG